jgi:hypothetical protein
LLLVQAQLREWELEIVLLSDLKAEQISVKRAERFNAFLSRVA